jgi:tetratricopeptide (TPR) repeat protein
MRMLIRMISVGFLLQISLLLPVRAAEVHTYWLNRSPEVREAYQHFYDLDYPGAVARFERIRLAHPKDPVADCYLLNAVVFQELFRQDLLDTTFYANDGFLTGKHPTPENNTVRDRIFGLADGVVGEANERLKHNSNDEDALFARGWARSLKATYIAMVERGFGTAFHLALQAHGDHARLLEMDPQYVDAKLVVGVYQYTIGALPLGFKIMFGFAGMFGSKNKGLELLRDDAARGVLTSTESRTVIALFERRESKYQDAIKVIRALKQQYPHDFLFALEEANLLKDSGQGPVAIAAYRAVLADAARPGFFPASHDDLAWFGLADTLRGQTIYPEAAQAFERAATAPTVGAELKRRSYLAAGQCWDTIGHRKEAVADYNLVLKSGESTVADQARKFLRTPYRSK